MSLAKCIGNYLKNNTETVKEISRKTNISEGTLTRCMRNDNFVVSEKTFIKFANRIEISVTELLKYKSRDYNPESEKSKIIRY